MSASSAGVAATVTPASGSPPASETTAAKRAVLRPFGRGARCQEQAEGDGEHDDCPLTGVDLASPFAGG